MPALRVATSFSVLPCPYLFPATIPSIISLFFTTACHHRRLITPEASELFVKTLSKTIPISRRSLLLSNRVYGARRGWQPTIHTCSLLAYNHFEMHQSTLTILTTKHITLTTTNQNTDQSNSTFV